MKQHKFIIQDGKIRMGKVEYHRDLANKNGSKPIGGGKYFINKQYKRIYFYDQSAEFGPVQIKELCKAKESLPQFADYQWYYNQHYSLTETLNSSKTEKIC